MVFSFVIDNYINKYLPQSQLHKLPKPLAYFLGYHDPPHPRRPIPDYLLWSEIMIGSFAALALIMGIFKSPNVLTTHHHAPMLLASYAASAILTFNTNQVPLAQPRNVLFGHFSASLIGISIQKLFSLSSRGRANYWASGALSVAVSSVVMSILNCVHPPAGASAVLPSLDPQVREMSWWFLALQVISSVLIITVACITGNVIRSYPVYWWYPDRVNLKRATRADVEKELGAEEKEIDKESSEETEELGTRLSRIDHSSMIVISPDSVIVPEVMNLDEIDVDWLKMLQLKLAGNAEVESRRESIARRESRTIRESHSMRGESATRTRTGASSSSP
ncbi:uncharacterized protein LODBEIA_P58620 [Lodderomyces beijingensis]|uniref:HPP transmembrane region domain-containing protein n=1 Tax=Lodderomyces beijingensis TaxID=1775926 RepID=A0ABP0ZU24_9ASCO